MTTQTARIVAAFVCGALISSACGGDDDFSGAFDGLGDAEDAAEQPADAGTADDAPVGDAGDPGAVTPEADGPIAMNTMRIGSQVWERTLPMTTGQCYLYEDDGNLPTSANVWGTADGDERIHFSANYNQDGTFAAEVDDQQSYYWVAGPRSPGIDDLTIELDFEQLIVEGSGTFYNALTGEQAEGSFLFQCEPDDQ